MRRDDRDGRCGDYWCATTEANRWFDGRPWRCWAELGVVGLRTGVSAAGYGNATGLLHRIGCLREHAIDNGPLVAVAREVAEGTVRRIQSQLHAAQGAIPRLQLHSPFHANADHRLAAARSVKVAAPPWRARQKGRAACMRHAPWIYFGSILFGSILARKIDHSIRDVGQVLAHGP